MTWYLFGAKPLTCKKNADSLSNESLGTNINELESKYDHFIEKYIIYNVCIIISILFL